VKRDEAATSTPRIESRRKSVDYSDFDVRGAAPLRRSDNRVIFRRPMEQVCRLRRSREEFENGQRAAIGQDHRARAAVTN
jgi:hypothetical protein